jgi:hypothetical protein
MVNPHSLLRLGRQNDHHITTSGAKTYLLVCRAIGWRLGSNNFVDFYK